MDAIGQFFWEQLESAPETGYLGLLSLDGSVSGIGVRRRQGGRLRVESVAFREPSGSKPLLFEPLPARQRQFFSLDPSGRPMGRIVEHDFNSPWDSSLETALRQARDRIATRVREHLGQTYDAPSLATD